MNASSISLPRLYAIVDAACFPKTQELVEFARKMMDGGVSLLQYRNKSENALLMLEQARESKEHVGHCRFS